MSGDIWGQIPKDLRVSSSHLENGKLELLRSLSLWQWLAASRGFVLPLWEQRSFKNLMSGRSLNCMQLAEELSFQHSPATGL